MDDFVERASRHIPTSSVMPFGVAKEIVASFGERIVELANFKVKHFQETPAPLSLPMERLNHSKRQIQIALAITVAEYVLQSVIEPSDDLRRILICAARSSGDLAWFTREPVFVPLQESDSRLGLRHYDQSEWIYLDWQKQCEQYLKQITEESPSSDAHANWQAERALVSYWQTIDRLVPRLLSDPVLIAIRET